MQKGTRFYCSIFVLSTIGACLLTIGCGAHSNPLSQPIEAQATVHQTSEASTPSRVVESQQLNKFSVLRGTPLPPSHQTQDAIKRTLGSQFTQFGLNFNIAHRVVASTGMVGWIIPGHGVMCIFGDQTGDAGCNTTTETIARGMTLEVGDTSRKPTSYYILGMAPDTARTVNVHIGARTIVVPITHNVYSYRAHSVMKVELPVSYGTNNTW